MSGDMALIPAGSTALAILDPACGEVDPHLVAWLEEQYGALRGLLTRTARDLVTIGRLLAEVKEGLAQSEFLAFLAALGLSRATAYRWMAASKAAAGCSQVENVEPTALYVLAAKSTPEEVREAFFRRADAGHAVTLQEVQATLREHREPKFRSEPNLPEHIVDLIVEAEDAGVGRDWRGRDVRAERLAREIGRFREDVREEVATAVELWGRACITAATTYAGDEAAE